MGLSEHSANEQWLALTERLVATGRSRGASLEDAEDEAQEALARVVRYDGVTQVPRPDYAGQALRLAHADAARKRARLKAIPAERQLSYDDPANAALAESASGDAEDIQRRVEFMESVEAVRSILSPDAVEMTMKLMAGWTEAEVQAERSPLRPSTGALRKQIFRALPELTEHLLDN